MKPGQSNPKPSPFVLVDAATLSELLDAVDMLKAGSIDHDDGIALLAQSAAVIRDAAFAAVVADPLPDPTGGTCPAPS